jgi:hypothetical protein
VRSSRAFRSLDSGSDVETVTGPPLLELAA